MGCVPKHFIWPPCRQDENHTIATYIQPTENPILVWLILKNCHKINLPNIFHKTFNVSNPKCSKMFSDPLCLWNSSKLSLTLIPSAFGLMSRVSLFPVPNLKKSWFGFAVDFSIWLLLHVSCGIFFSCSELTAFTSLSVADSVNKGLKKNWLNLSSAPSEKQSIAVVVEQAGLKTYNYKISQKKFYLMKFL